jgi:hypothetical protein
MEVTINHVQAPEGDTDYERCEVAITTTGGEVITIEVWADKYSAPGAEVIRTDPDGTQIDLLKVAREDGVHIHQAKARLAER